MSNLGADDVSRMFVNDEGDLCKCIGYSEQPTITMELVGGSKRLNFAVDSPLAASFRSIEDLDAAELRSLVMVLSGEFK